MMWCRSWIWLLCLGMRSVPSHLVCGSSKTRAGHRPQLRGPAVRGDLTLGSLDAHGPEDRFPLVSVVDGPQFLDRLMQHLVHDACRQCPNHIPVSLREMLQLAQRLLQLLFPDRLGALTHRANRVDALPAIDPSFEIARGHRDQVPD